MHHCQKLTGLLILGLVSEAYQMCTSAQMVLDKQALAKWLAVDVIHWFYFIWYLEHNWASSETIWNCNFCMCFSQPHTNQHYHILYTLYLIKQPMFKVKIRARNVENLPKYYPANNFCCRINNTKANVINSHIACITYVKCLPNIGKCFNQESLSFPMLCYLNVLQHGTWIVKTAALCNMFVVVLHDN